MQLSQAVSLIQHSIPDQKTIWADLGSGEGLFTNALSQLLTTQSLIYAVDKNKHALKNVSVKSGIKLEKLTLDFINDDLQLNHLSGILMANAFHFVKDKNAFIQKVLTYLDPTGYFILVEYDTDVANVWVPYPMSFNNLKKLFAQYNFATEKLGEIPSRYRGRIYSAIIHQ